MPGGEGRRGWSAGRAPAGGRPRWRRRWPAAPAPGSDAASSVAPATEGRELGELFEYNFATPVTVRKGESAMLPFLQQKIAARKLLIYSDPRSQNP